MRVRALDESLKRVKVGLRVQRKDGDLIKGGEVLSLSIKDL